MNSSIIREARESDLPMIEKLMAELVDSVADDEGFDMGIVSGNFRTLLNDDNSYILVAEADDSVIGVITLAIRRTLLHSGTSGLIEELVVSERHRGKGVGRQLIGAAIEKCEKMGCCKIEVSTETTNVDAREFYKSCGFEEIGILFEKGI